MTTSGSMKGKCLTILVVASLLAAEKSAPPRFKSGTLPAPALQTLGGGQVLLEAKLDRSGRVDETVTLRSTPPFTGLIRSAVSDWKFEPCWEDGEAKESRVLIAAVFLSPALYGGAMPGEVFKEEQQGSTEIPFPTSITIPSYPPRALTDGVLLLEAEISEEGVVEDINVLQSAPGFDEAAVQAAFKWKLRPAECNRIPTRSFAYLVFGFRQPVTIPGP